jgi:hypothetical protein
MDNCALKTVLMTGDLSFPMVLGILRFGFLDSSNLARADGALSDVERRMKQHPTSIWGMSDN